MTPSDGKGPKTGVIYRDENLARLREFPSDCIDLLYLDPPFFSNRKYEVIWGDESEIRSFKDRWKGGISHYVGWMRERIIEMHRILKPTGSLYLHCDPNASHYLKVMLDEVFGPRRFLNEIAWKRTTAHNDPRRYGRVQDRLLFYSKGAKRTFNRIPGTHSEAQLARYKYRDEGGPFRAENLTAPDYSPGRSFVWRGVHPGRDRHWGLPLEELERLYAEGRILLRRDGLPRKDGLKVYLSETQPPAVQDIWTDVPPIGPKAAERLGYPTQKPEALLERVIAASSNRGDVVLDPFCGCGTTVTVAHKMKRKWIGIDISPTAVDIIVQRLSKLGAKVEVVGGIQRVEDLWDLDPHEFQNFVIKRVYGSHSPRKVGDLGIDGYSFLEKLPIQVKQSDHVGRNVVDNFETAIRRAGKHKGYILAFSFTRGCLRGSRPRAVGGPGDCPDRDQCPV
ncbi:MAG: DNA methyltransferase [Gaiellaceae bacterium]